MTGKISFIFLLPCAHYISWEKNRQCLPKNFSVWSNTLSKNVGISLAWAMVKFTIRKEFISPRWEFISKRRTTLMASLDASTPLFRMVWSVCLGHVHATLHAALLVRQSVHPSVGCCLQSARNLWRSALFIFAYFHTFWYVLVRNKEKWQIF